MEWRRLRARYLAANYELNPDKSEEELRQQEKILADFRDYQEVVLWFEHDLFCQTNLIHLLNWFSHQSDWSDTTVSLICTDRFPGIDDFRGLGQLNPQQLASLFAQRQEVTKVQLELAHAAWLAYGAPDPTAIEQLLLHDTSPLPFLKHAFELHLQRFPYKSNGLGRIENLALGIVAAGTTRFDEVFARFGSTEPVYGLGDSQFWNALMRLSDCANPLLKIERTSAIRDAQVTITNLGHTALSQQMDFVELNGIDLWLGGVHLKGTSDVWRWDDEGHRLVMG